MVYDRKPRMSIVNLIRGAGWATHIRRGSRVLGDGCSIGMHVLIPNHNFIYMNSSDAADHQAGSRKNSLNERLESVPPFSPESRVILGVGKWRVPSEAEKLTSTK